MNPEQQRIAIAEACGWVYVPEDATWRSPEKFTWRCHSSPPDYLNDLNAMHEAEKALTGDQRDRYVYILAGITDPSNEMGLADSEYALFATAAQRAEAFLKTIGKWEVQP